MKQVFVQLSISTDLLRFEL